MDKIGANTYVVKYDDGKLEPVNVERMYTISIIDAEPSTRRATKNKLFRQRRRQKKRRRREAKLEESPIPHKRIRRR